MVTLAVTGHRDLTERTAELVRIELRKLLASLAEQGPLTGLSCLARGADTIFAEELVDAGGKLVVVLPSRHYRENKVRPEQAETFDRLVRAAVEVHELAYAQVSEEAYQAANEVLLSRADTLVAVWDGEPPAGPGGTGDVVRRSRAAGVAVVRVWPEGSKRAGG
ncbi:hypothetical protein I2501_15510 [Streptacidiphilus sp. NEAU-YB345]|uniref:DUF1273 family protein n=1 Tax=Streptacidiphilus fuscans TaxID=2789292 RepID=A0A931B381_9ACTN|nr:hypothetical protein [Streptacidiphilus fuscans]MBF9069431.1 hypothetical protein [Streptacidiphilus fuscans]